jgi:hypothetical protein
MKQDLELYYFNNNESSPKGISPPVEEGSDDEESDDEDREDIDDAAVSNDSNDESRRHPKRLPRKSISLMKMQAALQKMGRLRLANLLLDDEELSHP